MISERAKAERLKLALGQYEKEDLVGQMTLLLHHFRHLSIRQKQKMSRVGLVGPI